jgi:hypothetical protein
MTAAAHGVLHLRWPWQVIVCLEKAWTLVRLCNVTTGEGLSLKGTSNHINHVQAVACDFSAWILTFFNFWVQWFWQNIWKLNQYHNWDISDLTNRLTGWSWKTIKKPHGETCINNNYNQMVTFQHYLVWSKRGVSYQPPEDFFGSGYIKKNPRSLIFGRFRYGTTTYNYVQLRMCASLTSHVVTHLLRGFFIIQSFFILQIHPLSTQGGLSGKRSTIHVSQESILLTSFTQHTTLQYIIVFIIYSSFLFLALSPLFR